MKLFSLKSIAAIAIAASSFTSFAEEPSLQFKIRGMFSEVAPPCEFDGSSDKLIDLGSISSDMPIGTESPAVFDTINLHCGSKAKLTFYFTNPSSELSSDVYATTARHIGVKVSLNDKEINPGEKLSLEAQKGNTIYPFKFSLFKLNQEESGGGRFAFNLTGIIETEYM